MRFEALARSIPERARAFFAVKKQKRCSFSTKYTVKSTENRAALRAFLCEKEKMKF
jgi:hypothetical protein